MKGGIIVFFFGVLGELRPSPTRRIRSEESKGMVGGGADACVAGLL